jgi:pimeloyl-ACP methyl ester carboxylesterase
MVKLLMMREMYQVKRPPSSRFVPVRTLRYHVLSWGEHRPGATPLVLLHGWMDVAASFQFVVDALKHDRPIIAPDWRGFGLTASGGADTFWFADYLADLDHLLDQLCPEQPVDLLGHSMGGNLAMLYAGVRPQRVCRLINVEGFGLPTTRPEQAAGRFQTWLDQMKQARQGSRGLRPYASLDEVAARLMKNNQRLSPDKARWLAGHWARQEADGQWTILGEAPHKLTSALLYRVDETLAIHRCITAPTLMVEAEDDSMQGWWRSDFKREEHLERLKAVPQVRRVLLPDCGHMLHHDQPARLAEWIEDFLA